MLNNNDAVLSIRTIEDLTEIFQRSQLRKKAGLPLASYCCEIYPQMLEHILSTMNSENRRLRKPIVKKYRKAVREGRWVPYTGEAVIIFSGDRVLLNGQHSATAHLEENVPLQSLCVFEADKSIFAVIDDGAKRSGGDHIAQCGHLRSIEISSMLRQVERRRKGASITKEALSRYSKEYGSELEETVRESCLYQQSRSKVIRHSSVQDGLFFLFKKKNPVLAELFFLYLGTGADVAHKALPSSHPIRLVRDYLMRPRTVKLKSDMVREAVVWAWNYWVSGRRRKIFTSGLLVDSTEKKHLKHKEILSPTSAMTEPSLDEVVSITLEDIREARLY